MRQEDLLSLRRCERVKLLAGDRLIIGIAQRERACIVVDRICGLRIQGDVGVACGELLRMQAVEVAHGSQLVQDRAIVEIGELPGVVVDIRDSERIQVIQNIRTVHTPEGLGGGEPAHDRRVLIPEAGFRVGSPDKGSAVIIDRIGNLRHIIDPHIAVVGRRGAESFPERSKAEEILIIGDPVIKAGVVLVDAVGADPHNRKEQDSPLGAAETGLRAADSFRIFCSFRLFRPGDCGRFEPLLLCIE